MSQDTTDRQWPPPPPRLAMQPSAKKKVSWLWFLAATVLVVAVAFVGLVTSMRSQLDGDIERDRADAYAALLDKFSNIDGAYENWLSVVDETGTEFFSNDPTNQDRETNRKEWLTAIEWSSNDVQAMFQSSLQHTSAAEYAVRDDEKFAELRSLVGEYVSARSVFVSTFADTHYVWGLTGEGPRTLQRYTAALEQIALAAAEESGAPATTQQRTRLCEEFERVAPTADTSELLDSICPAP